MGVYTHSQGNWLSRRGTFLVILIAFHLALFWALKSGFAVKFVKSITEPIKAEIINEVKPEEPPPPPPTVKIELPPVQVPPILVDIPTPPDPPPTVLIAETTTEKVPPTPPTPPVVAPPRPVTKTAPGYAFRPDTADYYPNAARTAGEEGSTKVRICYDEKGKVHDSSVAEPSKYPRLDEAAVKYGKAVKVKPGTVDGKVQADCVQMKVTFSLKGTE
jgi:protein TonB